MGLDGGTYITRSDVLRGQSWALASADNSRSTRGGNVSASAVFRRSKLGQQAEKCVAEPHNAVERQQGHWRALVHVCSDQLTITQLSLPVHHTYACERTLLQVRSIASSQKCTLVVATAFF